MKNSTKKKKAKPQPCQEHVYEYLLREHFNKPADEYTRYYIKRCKKCWEEEMLTKETYIMSKHMQVIYPFPSDL